MKKYIGLFIVFFFGLITVIDLLHSGFAVTHDGQDHIARIANFYMNLEEGVFIPRWAPNLNWGYGHPILEFLYPLPSYVASTFHFVGFSLTDSTKLVFALSMLASGFTMYYLAKSLWGEAAGIVGGIFYMYTPYHFVDLYVRGDIGEMAAFCFVPLAFLGIKLLAEKQTFKYLLFATFPIALLILAHNAVALMFAPILFSYAMYLCWQKKWKKMPVLFLGSAFLFGFLLSGFFWFPSLLEGQYTLRNIVTKGEYVTRFVQISQLFYGPWSYGQTGTFTVQLGILQWISLVGSLGFIFFKRKRINKSIIFVSGLLIITVIALFLMLPASNFIWSRFMILQDFQFPWRFLAIPLFTASLLGGFCISQVPSKWKIPAVIAICLCAFLLSKDYMHARSYKQPPESFFTGIYDSTTDTGESSPIWSVRFMGQQFSQPLQVISGNVQITQEKRVATEHDYTVSSIGQSRLLENTLYFPGWRILVDNNPVAVQFQDPQYRGLMTFRIPDGTHTVVVAYNESKLRITGDVLSILGVIGIVVFLVFIKVKNYA